MKKTRSYILAALALAAAVLVAGYFLERAPSEHRPAGAPEKVTIAYSATTDAVLAEVAQVRGYYLQEGLEAVPRLHSYGKPALMEVLAGTADFATVAQTPVMFAIMKGEKISVVATIQTAVRANAIIVRKDRGIQTPSDLKGKMIAVTSGTTAEFFMDSFLAVHGIARKQVLVVDMTPEQMAQALAKGDIDAAAALRPLTLQQKLGARGTAFYDENIYTFTFNVVATQKFIRENPGTVRKMLRALIRAEEFVSRNPAEAQKIVAEFCRVDAAQVRDVWQDASFTVKLDQSLVLALEEETRWAVKGALAGREKMPNYLDYIYLEGLESIRPQSVRILR
jgi:sulfonate transport system substrate-binding protein